MCNVPHSILLRCSFQAVEDGARDVSFWKDFANATAKSATYQELGSALVKLKSVSILKCS